jgi:hypothetical protein
VPQSDIDEVLDDARLVINYAVRTGRLADDTLLRAVAALRTASPEDAPERLRVTLAALNDTIRSIAPMTLVELRAGLDPFDRRGRRRLRASQIFFSVLTIVIAALAADATEYLHRQDSAMKAVQEIQKAQPLAKLNALRKMVQIESILSKRDPLHYDHYYQAITEVRDLQERLSGAYVVLLNVRNEGPALLGLLRWVTNTRPPTAHEPSQTGSYGPPPGQAGTLPAPTPPTTTPSGAATPDRRVALGSPPNSAPPAANSYHEAAAAAARTNQGDLRDICDQRPAIPSSAGKTYPEWVTLMASQIGDEQCFSARLGLLLKLPDTVPLFFGIQTTIAALNGWVLPFLYGLLGASVYVMRMLLDPRAPYLGFAPALLRVALGGMAGIIIGWFAVTSGSKASGLGALSVIPFGLAFVAGFSIEVLFSLLDRVNRALSDSTLASRAS